MSDLTLVEQAERFATDLSATLQGALPHSPSAKAEVSEASERRVVVRPEREFNLFVKEEPLAVLDIRLRCQLDSRGKWLAVEDSSYALIAKVDRTPVIRFDYLRKPNTCPSAHVQVHAHRGALTHLLSRAGHEKPHDMSALHIPVGGSRFRPCLEDVVQFLIEECRFDAVGSWRAAIEEGRATWRRTQVKAVVRDFPTEAAEALERLGYSISAPKEPRTLSDRPRFSW
jgi:hypothetical protein